MVNGTLLNFGKRYEGDLRFIFDQWPKLHLGLDALSNQKILNGVYLIFISRGEVISLEYFKNACMKKHMEIYKIFA